MSDDEYRTIVGEFTKLRIFAIEQEIEEIARHPADMQDARSARLYRGRVCDLGREVVQLLEQRLAFLEAADEHAVRELVRTWPDGAQGDG